MKSILDEFLEAWSNKVNKYIATKSWLEVSNSEEDLNTWSRFEGSTWFLRKVCTLIMIDFIMALPSLCSWNACSREMIVRREMYSLSGSTISMWWSQFEMRRLPKANTVNEIRAICMLPFRSCPV